MNSAPKNPKPTSPLKVFFTEHKRTALALIIGFVIILAIIIILLVINKREDDGIPGDNSKPFETAALEDLKALKNYKIADYLPITSSDPAYTISYQLDRDDSNNYSLKLVLNAFAASARDACVTRLLTGNFGGEDPLKYEVVIENYYNPFTNHSLEDLVNNLPTNIQNSRLYSIDGTDYQVQTLTHTLYDGSTNTYRYILENHQPKTMPQLFYTYSELPFLSEEQVKDLNQLK